MRSSAGKIQLTSLDELFGTAQAPDEPFQEIPLADLHPFKGHPFRVLDDEKMQELTESVAQHGVLVPGIVRPRAESGYEQRERIIQTYTTHLPERVPLSQNGEFKTVRNAVVKAAVEVLKMEQLPQEKLPKQVESTPPVLAQSLALLRQTARIFEDKLQEYYAPQMAHTDRKLLSKIAEKKLAQGQKLGG